MRPMSRSTREIEVKLPFPSPREAADRLRGIGAVPVSARVFEDNIVWDDSDARLARDGRLLRLRTAGAHATLTFKGSPEAGSRYKVRAEEEIVVDDAGRARRFLEGLGFREVWRYQKYRTTFAWDGLEATVDETPIGCWVELEGDPRDIDRAAGALGFPPERYVTSSYGDLAREAASRTGRALRDVCVFDTSAPEHAP